MSILLHKYFNVYNFVVLLFSSSPPSSLFTGSPPTPPSEVLLLSQLWIQFSFRLRILCLFLNFYNFCFSDVSCFIVVIILIFLIYLFIALPYGMNMFCILLQFFLLFLHIPCIIAKSVNIEGVHEDPIESVECKSGLRHFVVCVTSLQSGLTVHHYCDTGYYN